MRLPRTSRSYTSEAEELIVGKGDYIIGGARSPAFLDLDNARHRRPVVYGEAWDTLEGYPDAAASMFSGRQTDVEEWAVMWKELGADGVCLRLTGEDSPDLVKKISERTRLPIMVSGSTDVLKDVAGYVDGTVLIIQCKGIAQSMELAGCSNGHVITVDCGSGSPAELCQEIQSKGASKVIADLGPGIMGPSLKELRGRIEGYRLDGLNGVPGSQHPVLCDVTPSWDGYRPDVTPRRASMHEATVALAAMMAGADMLVMKGPGAADMARVYGEELADL